MKTIYFLKWGQNQVQISFFLLRFQKGCAYGSYAIPISETPFTYLTPGKYYISTKMIFKNTNKPNTYALSAYGKNDITLNEITTPNFYTTLLQNAVIATYKTSDACYFFLKF